MTRTFWLSFSNPDKPHGQRFQGVCVIDVEEHEAAAMKEEIDALFPHHQDGAEWIAVATRLAWEYGAACADCEIRVQEIPSTYPVPRNRLLLADELERWGQKQVVH